VHPGVHGRRALRGHRLPHSQQGVVRRGAHRKRMKCKRPNGPAARGARVAGRDRAARGWDGAGALRVRGRTGRGGLARELRAVDAGRGAAYDRPLHAHVHTRAGRRHTAAASSARTTAASCTCTSTSSAPGTAADTGEFRLWPRSAVLAAHGAGARRG
jgi:hypothetical protein